LSNVKSIKQRAIEIANNSLSEIIIGVINNKYEPVVSKDFDIADPFSEDGFYFDYNERAASRREKRMEIRRERRLKKLNGY
jgi:hypothetical protein